MADGVGGEHQPKRGQRQHGAHQQRLTRADAPAGDRALGRALDVFVELAVRHIIDTTPRAAHEDGAQREHGDEVPARKAPRRQPQRTEGRPQQQQPARRAVPADQVQVQGQLGREQG